MADPDLSFLWSAADLLRGGDQPSKRDTVRYAPLSEDVEAYARRVVLPLAQGAWLDHEKAKVGKENPFNHHFYVFKPPRPLAELDASQRVATVRILTMLGGLSR